MPGILGYINNDKNIAAIEKSDVITSMCNSVMHEDWYKTDLLHSNYFAFARVHQNIFNPGSQPIYNVNNSLCIFMYGKIYDYKDKISSLESKGYKFQEKNEAEYCLTLFEEYGIDFVNELNGSFVILIYNLINSKVYIFNDRYGLRPTYYFCSSNLFAFACEQKALLAIPNIDKTVDKNSFIQFLYYGQLLGDSTFVKNIKVLPPASILIYENNTLIIKKYWQFVYVSDKSKTESEYIELLLDAWEKAVSIRMEDDFRYGIALSGGLDSRTILAGVPKEKLIYISAFTFGDEHCGEVKLAKEVANQTGILHTFVSPDLSCAIENYGEKAVLITDGLNSPETAIILNSYELIKQKMGIQICFDGLGGDALLGGGYLSKSLFKIKNDKDLYQYAQNKFNRSSVFSKKELFILFNRDPNIDLSKIDEVLEILLSTSLNTNMVDKYDSLIMYDKRVRRHTILGDDQMRSIFEEATPTFDNNFVDVFLRIPFKYRYNHRIYRKLFCKLSPDLAKIDYLHTNVPVTYPLFIWNLSINCQRILRYLRKKVVLFKYILTDSDSKKNSIPNSNIIRHNKSWQKFILEELSYLPLDVFNKDYIQKLFNDHINGTNNNSEKLSKLVSLGIFYKKNYKHEK